MVKHRELGSRAGVTSVTRQEVAAVARSAASWTLPLAQLAYQSLAWRRCRCDFILVARTPGVRAHGLQVNRPCSQASPVGRRRRITELRRVRAAAVPFGSD